jgi:hypothetical protein
MSRFKIITLFFSVLGCFFFVNSASAQTKTVRASGAKTEAFKLKQGFSFALHLDSPTGG